MMNDFWLLVLVAGTGLGLGLFFYGGLYLTVTRGLNSKRPALWFFSSFLLRMSLVMTGFYVISDGHWQRLIACLSGFVVIGVIFQVWTKTPCHVDNTLKQSTSEKVQHAA